MTIATDKYLLDTCICIHFLQKRKEVIEHIRTVGWENCCIAEVTIGELLCGIREDGRKARNVDVISQFVADIQVVPTSLGIREFAAQKRRLGNMGLLIEDFDLLIGSTAVAENCILVTENVAHMGRLERVRIENWVIR